MPCATQSDADHSLAALEQVHHLIRGGALVDADPVDHQGDLERGLGAMRVVKVDPAVLADGMFLIGRAWIKYGAADYDGAGADVDAAAALLPRQGIEAILFMIESGELPTPGPGPEAIEAWLEECRQAGAGELRLTLGYIPVAPPPPAGPAETHAEFLARLARIYGTPEAPPAGPIDLMEEMRAMGWI